LTKNVFGQFEKNLLVKHVSIVADSERAFFFVGKERRDRMAKAFKKPVQKVTNLK